MDQLVGASGEELSFTMYWLAWAVITDFSVMFVVQCYSLPGDVQYSHLALFAVSALLFIAFFILLQCFSHLLVTTSQKSNPFTLIAQVLNYARKHKFPERRSAFTYWEEECPSHIDLSKDKYGGPLLLKKWKMIKLP